MTGSFEGDGQGPLMLGASARLTARVDLASLRNKSAQFDGVFVVDIIYFVAAEGADFTLRNIF